MKHRALRSTISARVRRDWDVGSATKLPLWKITTDPRGSPREVRNRKHTVSNHDPGIVGSASNPKHCPQSDKNQRNDRTNRREPQIRGPKNAAVTADCHQTAHPVMLHFLPPGRYRKKDSFSVLLGGPPGFGVCFNYLILFVFSISLPGMPTVGAGLFCSVLRF